MNVCLENNTSFIVLAHPKAYLKSCIENGEFCEKMLMTHDLDDMLTKYYKQTVSFGHLCKKQLMLIEKKEKLNCTNERDTL